ncbi:site-specific integrase [Priestia filamentosa]|uniref:site-specific integrase n=1 Tax=Priestia filamentosa TaxID=1402861 RepID=UPI002E1D6D4A|nr:site-specific integrase [Priestia filamentosa]
MTKYLSILYIGGDFITTNVTTLISGEKQVKFITKAVASRTERNTKYAMIALKNEITNVSVIHPISDFILKNWKHSLFNTQKHHANNIIKFLNFLITNNHQYRIKSLEDIDIEHGTEFLNHLTYKEHKPKGTVRGFENTLIKFYLFLYDKAIIQTNVNDRVNIYSGKHAPLSPFQNVHFLHQKKKEILHFIPEQYIFLFLELAYQLQPNIALGVYMQFFGGLRVGELVNLRVMDLKTIGPYGQDGLLADLQTRNFRDDLKSTCGNDFVKKPRIQLIYGYKDILRTFYKQHMRNIIIAKGDEPLFQNKQHNALTGSMYRYYFNNLKKQFLNYLRQSDNPVDNINALSLENTSWSTHIGRGIFSNLIAEEAENLYEVSFSRGDSSLESVLPYFSNTKRIKEKLEQRLNGLLTSN